MSLFNNDNQKEEEDFETYEIDLICSNCDMVETYEIKKGMSVESFIEFSKCSYCECEKVLNKDNEEDEK